MRTAKPVVFNRTDLRCLLIDRAMNMVWMSDLISAARTYLTLCRWPAILALSVPTLATLLSGCIPSSHVDASPVAGVVLDRSTHRPVAGSKVVLSVLAPEREAQTQTDQAGRFHLAGFRHLEFTPLPYSMFVSPNGRLRVEAPGYQPFEDGEWVGQNSRGYFNWNGGNGVGGEQHIRVLLAPVGSHYPSSDGHEGRHSDFQQD